MSDMPNAASSTEKPKRRFRMGCLGFCVCIFLLFILIWISAKIGMERSLNADLDKLRAVGEPVMWEEVIAGMEPIPDDENSALLLERYLMSRSPWSSGPAGSVVVMRPDAVLGVRRSDEMTKLMRVYLAHESAALELLHDAARLPGGRWLMDSHPFGYMPSLMHIRHIRGWARLLRVESQLRAAEGDGHAAARSVRAIRRLAASVGESPHLMSMVTRGRTGALGVDAAEGALGLTELPAEDLAMLRDEFATEAEQLSLRVAALGGRARALRIATERPPALIREYYMPNAGERVKRLGFALQGLIPGVAAGDALFGLKLNTQGVALLDLPPRELLAAARSHSADCSRARRGRKARVLHSMSVLYMPSTGRTAERLLVDKQRLHVARTALAVEQFRMKRGRWPEKLTELVPDYIDVVPQDWFVPAGTIVGYARTSAGARVWSRYRGNLLGLTQGDEYLKDVAQAINQFSVKEGRLPKALAELLKGYCNAIPVDPRTGKPPDYVTNLAGPDLFILGGFTGELPEAEFWKQAMTTEECADRYRMTRYPTVFRLLNPELRGARRGAFSKEVDAVLHASDLYRLGYTPERLKQLGFKDDDVDMFRGEVEEIGQYEEEKSDALRTLDAPDVPADTQAEARP
jgi:hypothetical protein